MSNPTSNFGWQMPTATDLVTDLPADFEVFGQAVDTTLVDLKGGTTGQILAKNTNTDMDFVWITNDVGDITAVTAGTGISGGGTSGAVTITNSMATEITAKADLIVGTGNATFDNLPVGANGTVLTADSTVSPTGLKWATPASGGKVLQVVSATYATAAISDTSTYAATGLSATITPSSATSKVLILVTQNGAAKISGNAASGINIRLNRGSGGGTTIWNETEIGFNGTSETVHLNPIGISYLDSPATTSATVYETYFANAFNGNRVQLQSGSVTSTIILMEIGA